MYISVAYLSNEKVCVTRNYNKDYFADYKLVSKEAVKYVNRERS